MVLKNNNNQGFTLVELVTTIILIGILAVTVVPRLISVTSYSAFSTRNEIISALRTIQQRALSNSDLCYRVAFNASGYTTMRAARDVSGCGSFSNVGQQSQWENGVAVTSNSSQTFDVNFDSLGGIELSNRCVGNCITVAADDTVVIELTTAGYINAN
ncbi:prepilin-type N-terminal cleavage/methylation domain-containing protein [Shewanella sp. 202IG2-18]|uniref:pilus assembly FimT family protein n=1 Tax=Parashewanella hymeniacidonis TaxID=2807618 RepID=UPI00195FE6EE|nr:prepilin-type N-terminal cleavage/methylation domain-containing protein [Parashewanella hymeniacidonis]MBM7073072.1 prepilin-type N-terminal cleavage/methylation domain-containing protein [Parashewanella hymeniacidonis]